MAAAGTYPVRVDASLDSPLSRWLWLFKWVLLIPHYIVLAFLWIAFVVLSVAAFFAILFTGRYPRGIFGFNVGVLRWTWRVQYYAIGAFATDRYPPFSLEDVPGYPAHLEIEYPDRLSRGLVLVKWWLLAIPHYIVVGLFTGGGVWLGWRAGTENVNWAGFGLIGILVVVAAIVLLVTGRYPGQIFDFVIGMNRWVLRVAAYAGLMTDRYPPFRMDMGGHEPTATLTVPQPPSPAPPGPAAYSAYPAPPAGEAPPTGYPPPAATPPMGPAPPAGERPGGWTTPRIIATVIGAVLGLLSLGMLGTGGTALWAQTTQRHGGYVDLGTVTLSTPGYAVTSGSVELNAAGNGWDAAKSFFGTVRVRSTSLSAATPVFTGIAASDAANRYLAGVQYASVSRITDHRAEYAEHGGAAPAVRPGQAGIWAAHVSGLGTQTLSWQVKSGSWTLIGMNADGSRPVGVRVNVAATLPALPWIATGLLIGGAVFLAAGVVLIAVPVRRAARRPS